MSKKDPPLVSRRNARLVVLMVVQVIALFVMIFRGIQKPLEIAVAGGLVVGAAATSAIYYSPPKNSRSDHESGA